MSGNIHHRSNLVVNNPLTPQNERPPFRSAIITRPITRQVSSEFGNLTQDTTSPTNVTDSGAYRPTGRGRTSPTNVTSTGRGRTSPTSNVSERRAYDPTMYMNTRSGRISQDLYGADAIFNSDIRQTATIETEPAPDLPGSSSRPVTRQQTRKIKLEQDVQSTENSSLQLTKEKQNQRTSQRLRNTDDTFPRTPNDGSRTPLRTVPSYDQLLEIIPKHCLRSSLAQSIHYVIKDVILIAILFCMGRWIYSSSLLIRLVLSPIYWFAQGTLFFSIFVLGHECGHGSFSRYPKLNAVIGTILHTFVLTPYYSWKISHCHHHKFTGNLDKDEIFYPIRKQYDNGTRFRPLFGLGLGWFEYLWWGFHPRKISHWNPWDPMFRGNFWKCLISILCVVCWLEILCLISFSSFKMVFFHYIMPLLVSASYIVVVTFLHHTDLSVPWYSDDCWGLMEGNLSSVDRDYGFIHDIIHTIGTHQIHHLFPIIPHYKLREATREFRKAYPQLVHVNNDGILKSFWKMYFIFNSQCIIPNDTKIHFYK